jgi:hypothetical protein
MTNYPNIESFYKENSRSLIKGEYRPVVSYNKDAEEYINKLVKIYEDNGCPEYVTVSQIEKGLNVTRGSNVATTESPLTWLGLGLIEDSNEILNKKDPNYKYKLTDDFHFIAQNKLIPGVHILNKLYSIKSLSTISKFTNLLICTLREGYIEDCIIDFPRDNKDYVDRVKDIVKRREYSSRVDKIYGYGLDTESSPHASMRAINNLVKLELIKQQGENEYGFPIYQITEFGHRLLEVIDSNLRKNGIQDFHKDDKAPLQQIFYGAPGTGKSHRIKGNEKVKEADQKKLVFRTTFHPDSDYSTFVGAYKPSMKESIITKDGIESKEEQIVYRFVPQAFLQAYVAAWNNSDENVFLVIEEINRGNCAQIFGDLFQLLDRDDVGESEYPIMADKDLAKFLNGKDESNLDVLTNKDGIKDGKLKLPKNLYIWATMNTSDQSLFPIDSAFKRRWDWEYMPIGYKNTNWIIEIGEKKYSWVEFQKIINQSIYDIDNSEDKQLGDYFVNADRTDNKISAETLLNKILFYIWNDVCKDDPDQIFKWVDDLDKQEKSIKFSAFFCDKDERDRKLQGFMAFHKIQTIEEVLDTNAMPQSTENDTPAEDNNEVNS